MEHLLEDNCSSSYIPANLVSYFCGKPNPNNFVLHLFLWKKQGHIFNDLLLLKISSLQMSKCLFQYRFSLWMFSHFSLFETLIASANLFQLIRLMETFLFILSSSPVIFPLSTINFHNISFCSTCLLSHDLLSVYAAVIISLIVNVLLSVLPSNKNFYPLLSLFPGWQHMLLFSHLALMPLQRNGSICAVELFITYNISS